MDQDQTGLSQPSSPSRQDHQSKQKEFPLDFFIEKRFVSQDDLKPLFMEAQSKYQIRSIHLDPKKQIPDVEGTAFSIDDMQDNKMNAKCEAANYIFSAIEDRCKSKLDVILLIPEGIVSFLIGSKGGQLKKISQETQASINVNQPIIKFAPRTVKIKGDAAEIFSAIKAITKKMQDRGVNSDDYHKMPEALNPEKVSTKAKLLFQEQVIDFIMKNRGYTEKKFEVQMKAKENEEIRLSSKQKLRREEKILQIHGILSDVQATLSYILQKVTDQFKKMDFEVKIVMPASFASKLIGASIYVSTLEGCQIRELATKSKGAQIKVLSDKDETDPDFDCLVQVAGNLQNKQEASKLILQQIECFKNGGPILESGKYILDNFSSQIKSSIKQKEEEPKHAQYSPESGRHSRSRSVSKKQRHRHIKKYERRSSDRKSPSSSYSRGRRDRVKALQTTLIVSTDVIDVLEKYHKLNEYRDRYNVDYSVKDIRGKSESTVSLKGKLKDCLIVIEEILNEQYKILRK